MKKILGCVLDTSVWLLLGFLVLWVYGAVVPNGFYRVLTIDSGSMTPTLGVADLIVITPPPKEISVGTVVSMAVDRELVTHRLVGYDSNGIPITKGDANEIVDNFAGQEVKIVGVMRLHIPWLGYPIKYLRYLVTKI
jgi:signal peptidase I